MCDDKKADLQNSSSPPIGFGMLRVMATTANYNSSWPSSSLSLSVSLNLFFFFFFFFFFCFFFCFFFYGA